MPGIPSKIKLRGRGASNCSRGASPAEPAGVHRRLRRHLAPRWRLLPHPAQGQQGCAGHGEGQPGPPAAPAGHRRHAWSGAAPGGTCRRSGRASASSFLPGEKAKIDYLLDLAKAGDTVRSRRRHERLPVEVPVNWHLPGRGRARARRPARHRPRRRLRQSNAPAPERRRGGAGAVASRRPGGDGVHRARGLDGGAGAPSRASASSGARATPAAASASASWSAA